LVGIHKSHSLVSISGGTIED